MKYFSIGLLLFIGRALHAQQGGQSITGKTHMFYSKILQENRQIWVHIPDNNSPDGVFAKQKYPVIYLLDGWEQNFNVVTSIVEELSGGGGNLSFPKMIIVGIPNTDRTRDLTPTHVASLPMMDSSEAARSGGGEKFISFIQDELFPHVDSMYPTAPYKILIGHSLGGLMSIYTLIHHSNLFNAYVAIDPSTFWDNQLVLEQSKTKLEKSQFGKITLFLAIANSMNSGIDTSIIGPIMRCNFQLRDLMAADKKSELIFGHKYYPEYDHNAVPVPAEYDALRFIFNFYNLNFPFAEFFRSSYKSDTILSSHYKLISRRMGYSVAPPEDFVNGIAYQLMSMNQFERAQYFFKMNIDYHPDSFNAYDSMGDLLEKEGKNKEAIQYYIKSLSIHETPETRKKLEKLETNK